MLAGGVQGIALENVNHKVSEGGQGEVHVDEASHGDSNTKAGSEHSSSERS